MKRRDSMGFAPPRSNPIEASWVAENYRSKYFALSFTPFHSSASGGAGLRSMIGFQSQSIICLTLQQGQVRGIQLQADTQSLVGVVGNADGQINQVG